MISSRLIDVTAANIPDLKSGLFVPSDMRELGCRSLQGFRISRHHCPDTKTPEVLGAEQTPPSLTTGLNRKTQTRLYWKTCEHNYPEAAKPMTQSPE